MTLVRVTLEQAAEEYLDFHRARRSTDNTMRSYGAMLRQLREAAGPIRLSALGPKHLEALFSAHDWSPRTRNLRRSQIEVFLRWARNRRYLPADQDPLLGWHKVRVPKETRLRIPVKDWPALLEACSHPVERAYIAASLHLCTRVSETSALRVRDVDLDGGWVSIYRVKTQEADLLPITVELDSELRRWLAWYTSHLAERDRPMKPSHYLFPPRVPEALKPGGLFIRGAGRLAPERRYMGAGDMTSRVLARAGYEAIKGEGTHTLRRSGARALHDSLTDQGYDGSLRVVQSILGHASSATTEVYLGVELDKARRNKLMRGKSVLRPEGDNVVHLHRDEREEGTG